MTRNQISIDHDMRLMIGGTGVMAAEPAHFVAISAVQLHPGQRRRDDGTVCKSYTETIHAGSDTVTREGTACRQQGGSWHQASA